MHINLAFYKNKLNTLILNISLEKSYNYHKK